MNSNLTRQFKFILDCENLEERERLVTKFFDSLPDKSSLSVQKILIECWKIAQEANPEVCEHLFRESESDTGEFGFGGDWWKE